MMQGPWFFPEERHRALGPVERIRELYGPAIKNLEQSPADLKPGPCDGDAGAPLEQAY